MNNPVVNLTIRLALFFLHLSLVLYVDDIITSYISTPVNMVYVVGGLLGYLVLLITLFVHSINLFKSIKKII